MSGGEEGPVGPDLTAGVGSAEVAEGAMLVGHVGDDAVLVARVEGALYAIGAHCTHYHGPLGEGLLVGCQVRCPWHHAHFCLETGEALRAPAIDPVGRWEVTEKDGRIVVGAAAAPAKPAKLGGGGKGPRRVVIAGGGGAGFAAAEMLRRHGFDGSVTILSADRDAPYDRPNCSKDYLAGEAPAEWMPLRADDWYADNDIDLRLKTEIAGFDPSAKRVSIQGGGDDVPYDALVLALGAEPSRPPIPGLDASNAYVLRSLAEADAILAAAKGAKRVAIVGASFIGLEVAAALRHHGLEVHVAAPEDVPLGRVLGDEVGAWIRSLHEANGVNFHLGRKVEGWTDGRLRLDAGEIAADFVVVGAGVRPRTALAQAAGLKVDHGVVVDDRMRTSAPSVYAAGDLARFPDVTSGQLIRVEHWVHAERQGQHAAKVILGDDAPFADTPFFWSVHYGSTVNYVGHAETFDRPHVDGSLKDQNAEVRYVAGGKTRAVATVGRDLESLKAGLALEPAGTSA